MICFLDVDGILTDFIGGACDLHGVPNPYLKPENYGEYGLEKLVGISPQRFYGPMNEEFWANLVFTPEAGRILDLAESKFGQENVCLLTAPIRTHGCLEGKRRWIEKNLPRYAGEFLIGRPKEKCAGGDSLLIDDSDTNIRRFRKAGGRTITFPRPWNSWHHLSNLGLIHLEKMLENL